MRQRWRKIPFSVPCALSLCTVLAWIRCAPAYDTFLEVSKSEAGFTVEAEEANLVQILQALGKEGGFTVRDSGAAHPPIDLFEVEDATLETTLRRLLGNTNHLILYRGDPQKKVIDKIILLSPGEKRAAARPAVSSLAGPGARPRASAPREDRRPRSRDGEDPDLELTELENELLEEEMLEQELLDEEGAAEEVAYREEDLPAGDATGAQIEAFATGIDEARAQLPADRAEAEAERRAESRAKLESTLTPTQLEELRAAGLELPD